MSKGEVLKCVSGFVTILSTTEPRFMPAVFQYIISQAYRCSFHGNVSCKTQSAPCSSATFADSGERDMRDQQGS